MLFHGAAAQGVMPVRDFTSPGSSTASNRRRHPRSAWLVDHHLAVSTVLEMRSSSCFAESSRFAVDVVGNLAITPLHSFAPPDENNDSGLSRSLSRARNSREFYRWNRNAE